MRYALDALRRRPARSAATALGIGLATALIVILLSLAAGIQSSAQRLAGASGIDLLATSADTSLASGTFPPVASAHTIASAIERKDPNVAAASPWLVTDLVYANASLYAAVNASTAGSAGAPSSAGTVGWIPGANAGLETPALLDGPGFSYGGDPHFANGTYNGPLARETELDQGLASLLHVGPGDLVWVSARTVSGPAGLGDWFANATAFRVVGITQPFFLVPSALLGFFYLSDLQTLLGFSGSSQDFASLVLIHLADASDPSHDQGLLAAAFPSLTFFTIGNVLTTVQQAVDLYRTFGDLIGAIALVVATLFTTTVLLMSVEDRSRELALLRAIGYRRARIGLLVLEEGAWISAFGLAIGLGLGWLGATALSDFLDRLVAGLPAGFSFIALDPTVIATAVAEVLLIALVASLAPAARAMGFSVAEELRAP
jgi:putative ABC transport system permease protein